MRHRRELRTLETRDERVHRTLDDLRQVTAGNGMPQQILRIKQLVVQRLRRDELDAVAVRADGRHQRGFAVRGVGPRRGDEALDLALRFVSNRRQKLAVVLRRQKRLQQANRRQAECAALEIPQHDRVPQSHARDMRSGVRRILGELQYLRTVRIK